MTIVVYKCDVCKRDIELEQNIKGLENIQRCTITHGCRGKLYQTKVLPDFVRGRLPDRVAGLDDWRQRAVLYNHKQTIERDEWTITHNLGTFPSVSVFVNIPTEEDPNNQEEVIPTDTVIVDSDTLKLTFDTALSGLAQLVARQSDPNLLRPFVGLNVTPEELQQLSLNGDIGVATRISTVGEESEVDLAVEYTTTANVVVPISYKATDDTKPTDSPWRSSEGDGVLKVVIKGKTYIARSFNGNVSEITDGTIGSGSTFKFTEITLKAGSPLEPTETRDIAQDEVFILFANKPFDQVDIITTQYIDVYDVIASDSNFTFIYDDGEFFADKDIIQNVYPPIRSIQI